MFKFTLLFLIAGDFRAPGLMLFMRLVLSRKVSILILNYLSTGSSISSLFNLGYSGIILEAIKNFDLKLYLSLLVTSSFYILVSLLLTRYKTELPLRQKMISAILSHFIGISTGLSESTFFFISSSSKTIYIAELSLDLLRVFFFIIYSLIILIGVDFVLSMMRQF